MSPTLAFAQNLLHWVLHVDKVETVLVLCGELPVACGGTPGGCRILDSWTPCEVGMDAEGGQAMSWLIVESLRRS